MINIKNIYFGISFFATALVYGQTSFQAASYPQMGDNQAVYKEPERKILTVKEQIDQIAADLH